MTNDEIGTVLLNIGNLLQIQGEDSFRARIYERAADAIDDLTVDLGQLAEKGTLQSIPGIGKAIEEKVIEMLEMGRCHFYDNLMEEMGDEVLDLLAIRGVGVKTAARFYNELDVKSLWDLRAAIDGSKFKDLKGIGSKTIAQINEGLCFLEEQRQLRPLWQILPIAQAIFEALKNSPKIGRVDFTGELRRHEEILRSLELAAECASPETIVEVLAKVDEVKEPRIKEGDIFGLQSVEASVDNEFPLCVYALSTAEYDAGLLITTGAAEHLSAFNQIAEAHNLEKIDGHLPNWLRDQTEPSIYDTTGLQFIAPELRRSADSIDVALTGDLPTLVELSDFRGDLHTHTVWSDGRHSIREMVEAAKACGHEYIAITDHSESSRVANGLTPERLLAQIDEVREINEEIGEIEVFAGSEVDIRKDGRLDFPDEILAQLDIVVASVHSGFTLSETEMTNRVIRAIENPFVNIIGHPTGRLLGRRPGYAINLDTVIQAAAANDVVLEINASPSRLDLEPDVARKASTAGVLLTVNTDAHAISQLEQRGFGINVARRGWLKKEEVINTYQLEALHKILQIRNP